MRPTFAGFETAKTGIYTAQSGINLTGHNIANAETPGFTRQRLDVAARMPYGTMVRLPPVDNGIYGNGVTTLQVTQIRDAFLDREFRDYNTDVNYWSTKADGMNYLQGMFDPTIDNEVASRMEEFFDAMANIYKKPEDSGVRSSAKKAGQLLCDIMNIYSKQITDKIESENKSVEANVKQINDLAKDIAAINKQIYAFELSGHPANDLRDSLNVMLDELSGLTDITYSTDTTGKLTVYIGKGVDEDQKLVSHTDYKELEIKPENGKNIVYWKGTSNEPALEGGELKGHIDMRDGEGYGATNPSVGLPLYLNKLNTLAKAIVEEVNKLHTTGYTLDVNGNTVKTGIAFFDPGCLTAGNMKLSQDIIESELNIAAADDVGGEGNNRIALLMGELYGKTDIDTVLSFDGFLQGMMADIGSDAKSCIERAKTSLSLTQATDNMRLSISGVSLDEEMSNLIKYQHSYSAAARALTTMDEALDILINRTGRVGL